MNRFMIVATLALAILAVDAASGQGPRQGNGGERDSREGGKQEMRQGGKQGKRQGGKKEMRQGGKGKPQQGARAGGVADKSPNRKEMGRGGQRPQGGGAPVAHQGGHRGEPRPAASAVHHGAPANFHGWHRGPAPHPHYRSVWIGDIWYDINGYPCYSPEYLAVTPVAGTVLIQPVPAVVPPPAPQPPPPPPPKRSVVGEILHAIF